MGRIKFVGWYGRGNCGDEAFRDVHRLLFPEYELEWVTDIDAVSAPEDVHVLGGGDVFLPYYLRSIPEDSKFFVFGVGLGSDEQLQAVADHRHRLLGVWLRNPEDVSALRTLGVAARFTPDIVFNLHDQIVSGAAGQARLVSGKRKSLALILSNTATQDSYRTGNMREFFYAQYMRLTLTTVMEELGKFYDVYGIPFSSDRNDFDLGYLYDVFSGVRRQGAITVLDSPMTPVDMGATLANMELIVSMKFHGLVFAAMAGVPFVNIGLTRKTQLIGSQLGLGGVSIPPYSMTVESMVDTVKRAEDPHLRSELLDTRDRMVALARSEAELFARQVRKVMAEPNLMRA